jgi:hypothetical protein
MQYSNDYRFDSEWLLGEDIDSSGTYMMQGTTSDSAVVFRGHGKARNLSDIFVCILNWISYFHLVSKTKVIFEQWDLHLR